jgi:hypothetical protein
VPSEDSEFSRVFQTRRESNLVCFRVSCGEKQDLLVRLETKSLERDADRNVLVNRVVPEVDLALFRDDIGFGFETAMSRAARWLAENSMR